MISKIAVRLRWLRRKLSRSHLAAKLLSKPRPVGEADHPGLILLQIDGLSRNQMEKAMRRGNLPFLERLIKRRHFSLETFYSGLPSTTPAVQAEIHYGVRGAVPGFQFVRRDNGEICWMYQPSVAKYMEDKMQSEGHEPLLTGGRSYSNIYRAGADESLFCSQDLAPKELLRGIHPVKWLILSVVYAPKILRVAGLACIEFFIAIVDAVRGAIRRGEILQELQFVVARVAVSVGLRELVRFRVLLDIESGVKVIHANFLGYDEQSHRRGPGSGFAHWTLKGIDKAIRDIYRAAHRSSYRDYEIIVFSDHGQEHTVSFISRNQRSLSEALEAVFANGPLAGSQIRKGTKSELLGNTREWSPDFLRPKGDRRGAPATQAPEDQIIVTAMGPVGHIYLPAGCTVEEMESYAHALVHQAGIPLVMLRTDNPTPSVWNSRGRWLLPQDRAEIFGADHPLLDEVATDFANLCKNPNIGDFIICGWDPRQRPLSFRAENGAHAGPGFEETSGFLLVPDRIRRWHMNHLPKTWKRVRGEELRQIALHFLDKDKPDRERVKKQFQTNDPADRTLRVMTYNIHSCCGMDGKIRPERIARVINHFDPDLVAVQEVDVHKSRSGGSHQAKIIADHLQMDHAFHAVLKDETEHYGIAVFSRQPFEIMRSDLLTEGSWRREARGAMWLRIKREGYQPLHFINTHFGLRRTERNRQAEILLGREWLGSIPPHHPVILCGDFNSRPRSEAFRKLQSKLTDIHALSSGLKPRPGFPSIKPFLRLDHIFVSNHFTVEHIEVPRSLIAAHASDHLPLCAILKFTDKHEDC